MLEAEDARLIDYLHADFPLVDRPFEAVGDALGRSEASVIDALQEYYKKNGIAPMVRILSKTTGFPLKRIYELFPSGPGKGACKMAGLPKPTGCV